MRCSRLAERRRCKCWKSIWGECYGPTTAFWFELVRLKRLIVIINLTWKLSGSTCSSLQADFTFSVNQVQWTQINKQFQSTPENKMHHLLTQIQKKHTCLKLCCAHSFFFFLRNTDLCPRHQSSILKMSYFVLLLSQSVLPACWNTESTTAGAIDHFQVSLRPLQMLTSSNWCSDLHSTNCPRGTVCVPYLPPLAGREPAVEGPELW